MTSEYVTLGHPDKVADYISEYVLDRYIEKDPSTKEGSFDRQAIVDACGLNGPVFAAICKKGLPYYVT